MRIVGIGAGGHAKVLMDIARLTPGLELIGMLDGNRERWGTLHFGVPILGDESRLADLEVDAVFIGIGGVPSNLGRRRAFETARAAGLPVVRLVHPRAVVAESARLGEGVMIMGGAVVNPDAVLGDGVIVNTGAIVEHDCRIGDFVHVCPRAVLGGGVTVGEEAFVGIGSTVIQGVRVGARAVMGGGSVVIGEVPDDVLVVGCPARVVRSRGVTA
jgi:UDP-perosamine 4-acetyltransferase